MTLVYDRDIQSRKIFVGGLATTTDDISLVKYFEQYGDISDSIVVFDRLTGQPKRFGFVVYAKVSSMEKCLADCPHNVDGADVNVKHAAMPYPSKEKDERGNCQIHAVFPFGSRMDEGQIKLYFEQFGDVENVRTPMDTTLNRPKHFCFIEFKERTSVLKALDKKQHKMGEKLIKVTEFVEKKDRNKNYGRCGRKQDIKPVAQHRQQDNYHSRQSYHDNPYNDRSGYDKRGYDEPRHYGERDSPRSFRGPSEAPEGYEYVLVKKDSSRMDCFRRGPPMPPPMRNFDGYSQMHGSRNSPMMRGGSMRNRNRFNPMGRPQQVGEQQRQRKQGPPAKFASMQETKLFCGGLSKSTDDNSLIDYFSKYGEIIDQVVMCDKHTGVSKSFGFVTFAHMDAVERCLQDGPHHLDGHDINVKKAEVNPGKK